MMFSSLLEKFLIAVALTFSFLISSAACFAQEFFPPPGEKGSLVLVLSGGNGPKRYQDFAQSIARLGYSVFLHDGKDVPPVGGFAGANLKKFILEAQKHPSVKPGDLVVIGLSFGGGGALVNAVQGGNGIAGVIAIYPVMATISRKDIASSGVQVPTLLIAGEKDTHQNCCTVEYMNEFYNAAKSSGKPVELIVYPNAGHGFNLRPGPGFKEAETEQSLVQIKAFLQKVLPVEQGAGG